VKSEKTWNWIDEMIENIVFLWVEKNPLQERDTEIEERL
jgi:hypothetical protein